MKHVLHRRPGTLCKWEAAAHRRKLVKEVFPGDADVVEGNGAVVDAVQADLVAAVADLDALAEAAVVVADAADEGVHAVVLRGLAALGRQAQPGKHGRPHAVLGSVADPPLDRACSHTGWVWRAMAPCRPCGSMHAETRAAIGPCVRAQDT